MKPVYQTRYGGPEHKIEEMGNCFAAAIASLLEVDLESLPDLPYIESTWDHWDHYLAEKFGMAIAFMGPENEDTGPVLGYTIAMVDSALYDEEAHVVVAKDGEIVHDPGNDGVPEPSQYVIHYYGVLYSLDPATAKRLTWLTT